jgi:hypothetical protein
MPIAGLDNHQNILLMRASCMQHSVMPDINTGRNDAAKQHNHDRRPG